MRIGVIGGTGLYAVLDETEDVQVETPYGPVPVTLGALDENVRLVFLNRHGAKHGLPPHRIDARANISALAASRVDAVVAVNNVGGLRPPLASGHLVVPDDLVDLTGREDNTLFDESVVHVDVSEPYCPHVRRALLEALGGVVEDATTVHDSGVYIGVRGPRLETPAEVRWLATLGDVVGMTGCPEATLAREAGLCYGALCFVANPAAGLGGRIDAEGIRRAFTERLADILEVVRRSAASVPAARDCACRDAPTAGRLGPVGAPPERRAT